MEVEILINGSQCLNEDRFLGKYWVTCNQLNLITSLISKAGAFLPEKHRPVQMPIKHQLVLYFRLVGHKGMQGCTQRQVFLVRCGVITDSCNT